MSKKDSEQLMGVKDTATDKFDRQGNPISLDRFVDLIENDKSFSYRRVQTTKIGRCDVSTVWLGINHNFSGEGPPLIFETMIFGGPYGSYQRRYTTEDEAIVGHFEICGKIREGEPLDQ